MYKRQGRNHDVLQSGELREKLVELEDETEMLVAEIDVYKRQDLFVLLQSKTEREG